MNLALVFSFLTIGLIIGALAVYFYMKSNYSPNNQLADLQTKLSEKQVQEQLNKLKMEWLNSEINKVSSDLEESRKNLLSLTSQFASTKADKLNLEERFATYKGEVENIQKQFTDQFKVLANNIMDEKSKVFTQQNSENLQTVLNPLSQKLKEFEQKVEDTYLRNLRDQTSLQVEIKKLFELNLRISREADNLTRALKGDVKVQGNWGEVVLERILESSGLEKNREYQTQMQLIDAEGRKFQPDVVVFLPENKHILIDAKVSLVAFEQFANAADNEERTKYLKLHIQSIRSHVKELAEKKYYKLGGLNTPEYVLLFIPVESSFSLAIKEDTQLFNLAWENKIVIVSPSTLIATLLTVSSIWRQENQTKNAIEIAQKSGDLYDKFVGLLNDLNDVDSRLKQTQKALDASLNKIKYGRGNLIQRTEDLRKIGAKTSKTLPSGFELEPDELSV
ncbi:MAG: DNA recombination protein RmuC [Salinivirgaceae bacterium]|jgi:DNA recombination protein RmuC